MSKNKKNKTAPEAIAPEAADSSAEKEKNALSPAEELAAEKEKYAYLMAEYQNYRKRVAKDVADARFNGIASTLASFLKVADFLNMADTAAQKSDNIEAIRQGLQLIIAEYDKSFEDAGVTRLLSVGALFDPEKHEAMVYEPSETVPENHIIKEWSPGYTLGDRLLRPAKVVVSSGSAQTEGK